MKKKSKIVQVTMFQGAAPKLFRYSLENRNHPTPAEAKLWEALKGGQLAGHKFRRQHPIRQFILDFYCHQKKLAVEVDGDYHFTPEQQEYDKYSHREVVLELLAFPPSRCLRCKASPMPCIVCVLRLVSRTDENRSFSKTTSRWL